MITSKLYKRSVRMNPSQMKNLIIGNLKAKLPIIQGGMGVGISLSGLSSSVANNGGIGVIAAAGIGMHEPDFFTNFAESNMRALSKQIRKARALTEGILGVNIMVALSNFSDLVKTAILEGIDIIFSGAGLPLNLPGFLTGSKRKTKLVPIVSSGKAAKIISQKWLNDYNYMPDAIVVEGPKAGGHLGFKPENIDNPEYSLENLLKDVINQMKPIEEASGKAVPIIAAGGVYSGEDIHKMMRLGAAGVQMATRFVTTDECDASKEFKNIYIEAKEEDIGIINSPVGLPGRAVINNFLRKTAAGYKKQFACPYHCISSCKKSPYCIALALLNAKKGHMNNGFAFAGQNAYRCTSIVPVKELINTLKAEYAQACKE